MKYLTILVIAGVTIRSAAGLSCFVCENEEGHHVECSGENEKEKACGDHVIGCVEEVATDKVNSKSVTMRFCMDPTNATQPPSTSSYFAPMVADRLHARAEEIQAKGCMSWNTDKYQIDIFACDTANCNKDLGASDCAHVCTTKEQQPEPLSHNPRFLAKSKDESTASRCYECATESGLPTLCSAENEKVVDCAPHVIGCVENIIKSKSDSALSHEMRFCMDPQRNTSAPLAIDPRESIPVRAFEDEIYAKGCLKYYNDKFTLDYCICDDDECNKQCDCQYECGSIETTTPTTTSSTPSTPTTSSSTDTPGGGDGASSIVAMSAVTILIAVVSMIVA